MADWATINGQRLVSLSLTIPYYGIWEGEVVLASTSAIPTGPVTIVLGDITFSGVAYRQLSFAGSRSARVVGGYGGWQKHVSARYYRNPAGVPLTMILSDLATEIGEQIDPVSLAAIAGQSVGTIFVREAGPATRILKQLIAPVWWIDVTGATQVIDRASVPYSGNLSDKSHLGPITSAFNVIDYSGGRGQFKVASETLSDWMPGRTFTSPTVTVSQTISLVTHTVDGKGKSRTDVLTTG